MGDALTNLRKEDCEFEGMVIQRLLRTRELLEQIIFEFMDIATYIDFEESCYCYKEENCAVESNIDIISGTPHHHIDFDYALF